MDDIRAEWFRQTLRFARICDMVDKRTLWGSWETFCLSRGLATGSKESLWRWLLLIGAKRNVKCNYAFLRLKML